ncbi:MAG: asparagine synthase (glutamine-hydrolyzing) [Planctomycetes bacterium]|nr:asparagine synthase (glutamine-hydrolyzing) [Planctomycetota bacterium]
MCGIAGVVWSDPALAVTAEVVERMTAVLAHRGPDDAGLYDSRTPAARSTSTPEGASSGPRPSTLDSRPSAVLGHRRLSIIDLAGSRQPLCNEDGRVWVVFNGEIYNYRELRRDLAGRGHRFQTDGDTETIVHLYEEYGDECVRHLRGMFAFAVWDDQRGRLLLVRDRMGQKPLFYRAEPGRLWFGSELKALLQVPGAPRELDPRGLDEYLLYQYVPHPECILRGYAKLPPAHRAVFEGGRLTVERYWAAPFADGVAPASGRGETDDSASATLRETLTEAVRLRLRSDVPLGAFLSGGVDSTIIAGLMQTQSDRAVQTFSIGFPVAQFDERRYAREAAAHLGTEHHEHVVEPAALEILPELIWHYDEPFADSSAIPMMYLARVTRQHVTVALSGDGGDELFGGYDRYRAVALGARFDRLPRFLKRMLTARLWQRLPASVRQHSFRRRLKRLLAALDQSPERRYLRWIAGFDDEARRALYTDGFRETLGDADAAGFVLDAYGRCTAKDFVARTMCVDTLTYLPCDILTKVDIATMAASLECRNPFLDHHVVELAASMPIELKLHRGRGKRILLETFADLLPRSIQRRSKMGFGVPLDHWFRGELKPLLVDVLLSQRSRERGLFERASVERLIDEHLARRWDHSYRLWALLCLELWQQTFLDPATPPARPTATLARV